MGQKNILISAVSAAVMSFASPVMADTIEYSLRLNPDGYYTVYGKTDFDLNGVPSSLGSGQVTIVLPDGVVTHPLAFDDDYGITTETDFEAPWSAHDVSQDLSSPDLSNTDTRDVLQVNAAPIGARAAFVADVEREMFHFRVQGDCAPDDEIRLIESTELFAAKKPNSRGLASNHTYSTVGTSASTGSIERYAANYRTGESDCPNSDLTLLKTGTLDASATVGSMISYAFVVENRGNLNIDNVAITDPNIVAGSLTCEGDVDSNGSIDKLLVGASVNCTAKHVITAAEITAGQAVNTAVAQGTDSTGEPVQAKSDDPQNNTNVDTDNDGHPDDPTVTPLPQADITFSKAVIEGGPTVAPGETLTYRIVVSNDGAAGVVNVVDAFDPQFTYIANTATVGGTSVEPQISGTQLLWQNVSVAAGSNVSVEYKLLADSSFSAGTTALVNAVYEQGVTPPNCDSTPEPASCASVDIASEISIEKTLTAGGNVASAGEELTFAIKLNNTGGAGTINVSDVFDAQLSYVDASASIAPTVNGTTISWADVAVPANGSTTISYKLLVANPIATGVSEVANVAFETGETQPDCTLSTLPEECVVVPTETPSVTYSKSLITGGPDATRGEVLTFEVVASNATGTNAVVTVVDSYDDLYTYEADSSTVGGTSVEPTVTSPNLEWSNVSVPANDDTVIRYQLRVGTDIPTTTSALLNGVYTKGSNAPDCATNPDQDACASVPVDQPDVDVSIEYCVRYDDETGIYSAYAYSESGLEFPYSKISSAQMTIVLPDGAIPTPVGGGTAYAVTDNPLHESTWSGSDTHQNVPPSELSNTDERDVWQVLMAPDAPEFALSAGEEILVFQFEIEGQCADEVRLIDNTEKFAAEKPNVRDTASANSFRNISEIYDGNRADCTAANCAQDSDISYAKALVSGGPKAAAGETLSYRITITNAGGTGTANVEDAHDSLLSYVVNSASIAGQKVEPTIGSGVISWANIAVAADSVINIDYDMLVASEIPSDSDDVTNVVYEKDEQPADCTVNPIPSTCVVVPLDEPALTFNKQLVSGGPTVDTGEELVFEVTITNSGGIGATTDVSDNYDSQFTYVANSASVNGTSDEPVNSSNELTWNDISVAVDTPTVIRYTLKAADSFSEGTESLLNIAYESDKPKPDCETDPTLDGCQITPVVVDNEAEYCLRYDEDTGIYSAFVVSASGLEFPYSKISSAQMTFVLPDGAIPTPVGGGTAYAVTDNVLHESVWSGSDVHQNVAPSELTNTDERDVWQVLMAPLAPNYPLSPGGEIMVFQFQIEGQCPDEVRLIENVEKFAAEKPNVRETASANSFRNIDEIYEGNLENCSSAACPAAGPDVSFDKELISGGPSASAGGTLTYRVSVFNSGGAGAVDVADAHDSLLTYVTGSATVSGSSQEPTVNTDNLVWSPVAIEAGETVIIEYKMIVDDTIPDGVTEIKNAAYELGEQEPNCELTPKLEGCVVVPVEEGDVAVTEKRLVSGALVKNGKNYIAGGETLTFAVDIENTSGVAVTNVDVFDTPSSQYTYVSGSASVDGASLEPVSGSNLRWTLASVPANTTVTLTYKVTVADPLDKSAVLGNAAATDIAPPTPTCPADGTDDNVVCLAPTLTVEKSLAAGNNPAEAGDVLTYEITVTNEGGAEGSVDVVDSKDTYLDYVANSATVDGTAQNPAESGSNLTWADITVAADSSIIIRYRMQVSNAVPNDQDDVINVAYNNLEDIPECEETPKPGGCVEVPLVKKAELGDFVWLDSNGDGIQNSGEVGLEGVLVELLDEADSVVDTTATDENGEYLFLDITPGNYYVRISLPSGYGVSAKDQGSDDAKDSDIDPTTLESVITTITASESDLSWDAGVFEYATLGDRVWNDEDRDGKQDANEQGLDNVLVTLFDADGTEVASVRTAGDGSYLFTDLAPGDYTVKADTTTVPSTMTQTFDKDGTLNSDSGRVNLSSGENETTVDFGYAYPPNDGGKIGNRVWLDADQDGIQDPGELGIAGIKVQLCLDGVFQENQVTDEKGEYLFTQLDPGRYEVLIDPSEDCVTGETPDGYTAFNKGDPDFRDGESTAYNNATIVDLAENEENLDADFGYSVAGADLITLGDTVFIDINDDKKYTPGTDHGIQNVNVSLYETTRDSLAEGAFAAGDADKLVASQQTDEDGNYEFSGLEANKTYIVVLTDSDGALIGMEQTVKPDNAVDGGTAYSPTTDAALANLVVVGTVDVDTQDFGFKGPDVNGKGAIGDEVFFDSNKNSVNDSGEALSGVTVKLYQVIGSVRQLVGTQQTDESGRYLFTGLDETGTYQVEVDPSTLPNGGEGWANTINPAGTSNNVGELITFTTDISVRLDQDFGYEASGELGEIKGTVWEDSDKDGKLEGAEPDRFGGVTVELRDADGKLVATTLTNDSGNYSFPNLPLGTYTVVVTDEGNVLNAYVHTDGEEGVNNNSQDDQGYEVTIGGGNPVTNETADFGYRPKVTTPITLGSFATEYGAGQNSVVFKWTTETEVGNAGFMLYMLTDAGWAVLNDDMIEAAGESLESQAYEFTANDITSRQFVLVDVDIKGEQTLHGVFNFGETYGSTDGVDYQTDWDAVKAEKANKREIRKVHKLNKIQQRLNGKSGLTLSQAQQTESTLSRFGLAVLSVLVAPAHANDVIDVVNFNTTETGVYEVTVDQISNYGVDLSGLDAAQLGLSNQGKAHPIEYIDADEDGVVSSNDRFRFLAQSYSDLYTGVNVYTLTYGDSAASRINAVQKPLISGPSAQSYMAERVYAPNVRYALTSPAGDPWYANRLYVTNVPTEVDVPILIDNYVAGSTAAVIEASVWGGSDSPYDKTLGDEHHAQLLLNGNRIVDTRFDGITAATLSAEVVNQLSNGEQTITLRAPADTGYRVDVINLESVTVRYPRRFIAEDSMLAFDSKQPKFSISGFESNDISVYAQSDDATIRIDSAQISGNCSAGNNGCSVLFGGVFGGAHYIAVAGDKFKKASITVPADKLEKSLTNGMLIIAHPDFINTSDNALERYAQRVNGQIIDVESIYASYSNYRFGPQAIQDFIKDAAKAGVEDVLLVGGDVFDYHGYKHKNAESFIPSIYQQTDQIVNYSPVDPKYADINDDNIPDLGIARLPVRTSAELTSLVAKHQAYTGNQYGNSLLFAADRTNTLDAYNFAGAANQDINKYFKSWAVTRAFEDDLGTDAVTKTISDTINDGVSLMVYSGHSSSDQLSLNGLFDARDAGGLNNAGRPTVVAQWGCWNNYNVDPAKNSLSHKWLLDGEEGAVSVVGATTLNVATRDRELAADFYTQLNQGKSISQALQAAKLAYAKANSKDVDVLLGVSIMGFPDVSVN